MGRTVSMGTMQHNRPDYPLYMTFTKNEFPCGHMQNGRHIDAQRKLEVTLEVLQTYAPVTCLSCGRKINRGEIVGRTNERFGLFLRGFHCADCIDIPSGISAWELRYGQRKSRRCPSGTMIERIVHTAERAETYAREMREAMRREVQISKIGAVGA